MNPQYMPQQFGAQNFQNRPSPTVTPQSFQSVPLAPPKQTSGTILNGPPPQGGPPSFPPSNQNMPSQIPVQNRPNMPPNPAQMLPNPGQIQPGLGQIPPGQLPPGSAPTQLPPGGPSRIAPQPGLMPSGQPPSSLGLPPGSMPVGQLPPQKSMNPDLLPHQNQIPPTQNQLPPQNQFMPPTNNSQMQNGPAQFPPQNPPMGMNQLPPNQFNQPKPNLPPTTNTNQYPNQFGPLKAQPATSPVNTDFQNQYGSGPGGPPPMGSRPPVPGQFNQQPIRPGINQYPNATNLSNQMQNMNIAGQNFDNGPHMPPPLSQNYLNGSQMKSPMPGGYPPMPTQLRQQAPVNYPGGGMGQPPIMPGQPPMPGMQPPSGPYPQSPYGQPQPQKRLDPDQMPSPIQVMQDDQKTRSGVFCTNQKGLVPPLITTNFEVQDQGNSSPRYIRSTMYNIPVTQDLMKQTSVPFGLVISPMARTVGQEYAPPIVNFGELGPVRCLRCKAYMCPYMQFIDAGRRFQCLFCKATTDVPTEYFQHLDHTGQRTDRYERAELILGTYEFIATADYCRNNKLPKPPAIIFVIDVSYNNIKSGLVHLLCSQMKEILKNLPVDQGQDKSNVRVGFITYNSTVHFYNVKGTLAAPQMLIVGDVQDMFMPLLEGFLCTVEESEVVIDALMQQIPAMFGDTRETETILLPAILAGLEALKASECAGKLLVFHSTLPIAEAPGKLKNRDDRKLLGTDKERTVLTPQNQAYNQLGQDCVAAGCSVDLFLFNNAYIDVATIGQVSRLTGGEIFKYTYFQADTDGTRLIEDIITDISRPIAFDAIMRVRTSTGIRATDFYGHFFMSNTTDMELAAIDCDKAVAVEIKHDDKLTEEDGVYVQVALLYTSCSGQRRLRIINLSLRTCSQMADLYRYCELDTIINFFGKQSIFKLLENNPKAVKDNIVARAAQMLANYRKNCASPSGAGQLILPECMKLLPLYVNCLLKSDAMSGGSDITLDDRSFVMHAVMIMDIPTSVAYFYPRLIPLVDVEPSVDGTVEIPPPIRTTIEKITDQGVYILENGIHMFLYIGLGVHPEFLQKVFGVPTAVQVDIEKCELPMLDNPLSITIRSIIDQIRVQRHRCMRLTMVRPREKLEPVFKHFLVEDRGADGSASYVDFLCHMHKEIRTLLS